MGDAVGHGFDEDRAIGFGEGAGAGVLGYFADSEDVVAVDADGVDSIADAAGGNAVAFVLLDTGGGNGEAVVAADEEHRAGFGGGDVEGGVEVAFRGGAFAKVTGYDAAVGVFGTGCHAVFQLERVGGA